VRFVSYGDAIYAFKELPRRLAEREYRLLAELDRLFIPVVEVAGLVTDRRGGGDGAVEPASPDAELDAILITRHLDFSLPYRRDAGALAAYVVDTETGEIHPQLSDGQRLHDVMVAEENIAGELFDVTAEGLVHGMDPVAAAEELHRRHVGNLRRPALAHRRVRSHDCRGSTGASRPARGRRALPSSAKPPLVPLRVGRFGFSEAVKSFIDTVLPASATLELAETLTDEG
jgi:hypothetical protein